MKIVDRYILKELVPPFFLGLVLFTFVLLLNRIFKLTDLIVSKGVPLLTVFKLIGNIMPSFLTLTIPMAVLLAALIAFGRLSTDSEVTALKATGFSLYRLMAPVAMLAVVAAIITAYFSIYLGPVKARNFKKDLFVLAKTRSFVTIEEEVFNDTFKNVVIYAQKTPSPNEMEGVFISDERNPDEPYVIIAQKGALDIDPNSGYAYLRLSNGSIHKKGLKRGSYQEITFDTNDLAINLYDKLFAGDEMKKSNREMTMKELLAESASQKDSGGNYYPAMTEYYKRFSIPLACLIFGMVGPPLGLYSRRSGKSSGMTVALVIFALYYLIMKGGENLAAGGGLPPIVAALAPNIVIGALGAYILTAAAREKNFDIVSRVRRALRGYRLAREKSRRRKRDGGGA